MSRKGFYDLHSHFLPGIDDGAPDVQVSISMLKEARMQGARGMMATPHYYDFESIRSFLARREKAWQCLNEAIMAAEEDVPAICLGAEAAYHPGLARDEDLPLLCLGKSRYLLLEMPFYSWSPQILRDVRMIRSERGLIPVIAHLERYSDYVGQEMVDALLQENVLVQMNAGPLLHLGGRRKAIRMVKNGLVDVLGSDTHNMTSRPPTMGLGIERLKRANLMTELSRILQNSETIFLKAMQG